MLIDCRTWGNWSASDQRLVGDLVSDHTSNGKTVAMDAEVAIKIRPSEVASSVGPGLNPNLEHN